METARGFSTRVRVFVADSTRIHTELLSDILERDPDLQVMSWDCDRSTLVPTVLAQHIDVLAVSSALNGNMRDGLNVVREVCAAKPETKIVVLLDSHQDELVLDSLRAGAKGIFSKESSSDMLRKCLHSVHRGEIWVDSRGMSLAIGALASAPNAPALNAKGLDKLSKREHQVVELLVQGLSNREISKRMSLSPHTIKNYIFRIFDKMGVSSRMELSFLVLSRNSGQSADRTSTTTGLAAEPILKLLEDAGKGSATAALVLAQTYAGLVDDPENVLNAYKWYLTVSHHIAQAQSILAKNMTASAIEECQREAKFYFARARHAPVQNPTLRPPSGKKSMLAG